MPLLFAGKKRITTLLLLSISVSLIGCEDPDPAAGLRAAFKDLKTETNQVDEILASIENAEDAREKAPELEEHMRKMRVAGDQVVRLEDKVQSRSAVNLKQSILEFRAKRKILYQEEIRRLAQLDGVEDILLPILRREGMDKDAEMQQPPSPTGNHDHAH